jgi:hypothetical protein
MCGHPFEPILGAGETPIACRAPNQFAKVYEMSLQGCVVARWQPRSERDEPQLAEVEEPGVSGSDAHGVLRQVFGAPKQAEQQIAW